MSSIIICINNNLKYDMRVIRQVRTFAEAFDKVFVCAKPSPDRTEHVQLDNVEWKWFESEEAKDLKGIQELSRKYNLFDRLIPFAPVIADDGYLNSQRNIDFEIAVQETLIGHSRWDEIKTGTPLAIPDAEQLPWVTFNLDLLLQWADFVAGIEADVIYCNDFDSLLCGVVHKGVHGSRLVYDEHDIFCDSFPSLFPLMYRYFIAQYEYEFLKDIDALVSVSESAVKWTVDKYDLACPSLFVPNCKDFSEEMIEGEKDFSLPIRLYYQGYVSIGRGIEEIIEVLRHTEDAVLCLRCLENEYVLGLKDFVEKNSLENKVRFLDPVPPTEVISAAYAGGDIGLSVMGTHSSIGIRNTITNKLIEYLTAGMPVIVSEEMQDQRDIVKKYNAGFVIGKDIKEDLLHVLDVIKKTPGLLREMSRNARKASEELFRWDTYKERFLALVTGENEALQKGRPEIQKHVSNEDLAAEIVILKKVIVLIMENRLENVADLKDLKEKHADLWEDVIALQDKNIQLDSLRIELESEKAALEYELESMKTSKSWKLGRMATAPGRALRKIARKN